jgi:hypothetical protein
LVRTQRVFRSEWMISRGCAYPTSPGQANCEYCHYGRWVGWRVQCQGSGNCIRQWSKKDRDLQPQASRGTVDEIAAGAMEGLDQRRPVQVVAVQMLTVVVWSLSISAKSEVVLE